MFLYCSFTFASYSTLATWHYVIFLRLNTSLHLFSIIISHAIVSVYLTMNVYIIQYSCMTIETSKAKKIKFDWMDWCYRICIANWKTYERCVPVTIAHMINQKILVLSKKLSLINSNELNDPLSHWIIKKGRSDCTSVLHCVFFYLVCFYEHFSSSHRNFIAHYFRFVLEFLVNWKTQKSKWVFSQNFSVAKRRKQWPLVKQYNNYETQKICS